MTRFGFLLLLILFGLLMFVAGLLAPASMQTGMRGSLTGAGGWLARLGQSVPPAAVAAAPAALPRPGAAAAALPAPAAAAAAAAGVQAEPVPADSIILPVQPPEKAQYGLQLGQFAERDGAAAMERRLKGLQLPARSFDIVDRAGQRWSVVAAGPYAGAEQARAARAMVARDLGLAQPAPVILLPAPPKS